MFILLISSVHYIFLCCGVQDLVIFPIPSNRKKMNEFSSKPTFFEFFYFFTFISYQYKYSKDHHFRISIDWNIHILIRIQRTIRLRWLEDGPWDATTGPKLMIFNTKDPFSFGWSVRLKCTTQRSLEIRHLLSNLKILWKMERTIISNFLF